MTKKTICLTIDVDIYNQAKSYTNNMSALCQNFLEDYVGKISKTSMNLKEIQEKKKILESKHIEFLNLERMEKQEMEKEAENKLKEIEEQKRRLEEMDKCIVCKISKENLTKIDEAGNKVCKSCMANGNYAIYYQEHYGKNNNPELRE